MQRTGGGKEINLSIDSNLSLMGAARGTVPTAERREGFKHIICHREKDKLRERGKLNNSENKIMEGAMLACPSRARETTFVCPVSNFQRNHKQFLKLNQRLQDPNAS